MAQLAAAGDGCGAQAEAVALRDEAVAAVNDGSVPEPLRDELLASVESLAAEIECAPAAPAADPPAQDDDDEDEDDDDDDDDDGEGKKGKGKGKGTGKGRG